jgi:hypothetical protein
MPNDFLDHVRASSEEDAADITVYDLADRMSGGMVISEPGQREVASELLRVRAAMAAALRCRDGHLTLNLAFKAAIERLARSMGLEP